MAGGGDAERLVVLLEARIKDFEKNMAKASGTADRSYSRMRSGSRTATKNMERDMVRSTGRINQALAATSSRIGAFAASGLGALATGAIAALIPIISLSVAINGAKSALSDFDEIGKRAKAGGIDAEFFQELSYGAELGGVGVDQLAKALETFSKNTGLAAAGQGRLITQLKALNPELLQSLQHATSQEARLKLVADALDKEADASKAAAIASALFGDVGVRMVEVLKGGSSAMETTAQKARALGIVVSRDLIANAETLNDRFSTAQKVIDSQFKQALINLAPWLVATAEGIATLAQDLNIVLDQFRSIDERTFVRPLQNELISIENRLATMRPQIDAIKQSMANGQTGGIGGVAQMQQYNDLVDRALALQERLKQLQIQRDTPATPLDLPTIPELPGTGNAAASAAIKQAEAVASLIDNLQTERSLIGLSAVDQAKLNALRQAGAAATDAQRAEIIGLIEATAAERSALENLQNAFATAEQLSSNFASGLVADLRKGESATEALGNAFQKLADQLIEMAINEGIKALFRLLLGTVTGGTGFAIPLPGFAGGTGNTGGSRGDVRGLVHGQEAVVPLPDGGRIPVQLMGAGGQGGNRMTVEIANHYSISGTVSDKDVQRMIVQGTHQSGQAVIDAVKHQLPGWQMELQTNGGIA